MLADFCLYGQMSTVLSYLLTFACGAWYEAGCVFWVHHSTKKQAGKTSLWSMSCALAEIVGIYYSVTDLRHAPAFILGYGVGTYVAVRVNARLEKSETASSDV